MSLVERAVTRKEGEIKLKLSRMLVSSSALNYCVLEGDGIVPSHSAVAYVSEADEWGDLQLGSRVAISPFVKSVEHGEQIVRTMGVDVDGLLCDFVSVPSENVFLLPDGIPDEEAVFADYIAMSNKVFESLECEQGDYVVIVGAGTLGLILAQLASYYQMVPVLVDLDAQKLELAKKWGVIYTLNPTYDNLERRVEEITGGRMCDAAVFAGEGMGLNAALRLVKNAGEVIIAGYAFHAKHQVDMDIILKKQLNLKGVCNGEGEFSSAINLLANKIVKLNGLINLETYFDETDKAVAECVKYPYKYTNLMVTVQ